MESKYPPPPIICINLMLSLFASVELQTLDCRRVPQFVVILHQSQGSADGVTYTEVELNHEVKGDAVSEVGYLCVAGRQIKFGRQVVCVPFLQECSVFRAS